MELSQAVDEVLHYVWDPIGVSRAPEARDEYTAYALQVLKMLQEGADVGTLADYLGLVTSERMGLTSNAQHDLDVARLLVRWRDVVRDRPL